MKFSCFRAQPDSPDFTQEIYVIQRIPYMIYMQSAENIAIAFDRLHTEHAFVHFRKNFCVRTCHARITEHLGNIFLRAMIIALPVTMICSAEHILVNKHWTELPLGTRNFNKDDRLAFNLLCVHMLIQQKIYTHLVLIVHRVPESLYE